MKNRIILIALALVVIPTAILGLLASNALKARELIIENRIRSSADSTAESIADAFSLQIENEMLTVHAAMRDSLLRVVNEKLTTQDDIRKTVEELKKNSALISDVYVFNNPLGFLYPVEDGSRRNDALIASLRGMISYGIVADRSLKFPVYNEAYVFKKVFPGYAFYAGYKVNITAAEEALRELIEEAHTESVEFRVEGKGLNIIQHNNDSGSVIIIDPFESEQGDAFPGEPIADTLIGQPFPDTRIRAYLMDTVETRRVSVLRGHFFAWGILLLSLGIVSGVVMVLRQALVEIKQVRSRSDFLLGVSHDLRTPVASMKMLMESLVLGRVKDEARKQQFQKTVLSEIERLHQLVERVLFFVRFGQGSLDRHLRVMDPTEIVNDAVSSFNARHAHELGGVSSFYSDSIPSVQADKVAVVQVLLNLLDNAEKYGLKKGGSLSEIEVRMTRSTMKRRRLRRPKGCVAISVHDKGPGIPKKEQRKIFERFYRSAAARGSNTSGVGLGLALCRHVINSHGGEIGVQSTVGEGSVFTLYLPVADDDL